MATGVTIFICGIGGVGKTHLVKAVLPHFPEALAWRASEIILGARQTSDPDYLRQFPADEMLQSQELLVRGFEARNAWRDGRLVLLDAHTVIDAPAGFFDIPVQVIAQLGPQALVHVEDSVERIHERRARDTERKRPSRTLTELTAYQERSLRLCEECARVLKIPVHRVISDDEAALRRIIHSLAPEAA